MYPASYLFLVACFVSASHRYCTGFSQTWPRAESLGGFWPFDGQTRLKDVASNGFELDGSETYGGCPRMMSEISGPFDKPNSSYSVVYEWGTCPIGNRKEGDIPLTESFTFSFYFYTNLKNYGGIFDFFYGTPRFSLNYETTGLEIWSNEQRIGQFPSVLKANTWNYVALTYEKSTAKIQFYDENGGSTASATTSAIPANASNFFYVGRSCQKNQHYYMRRSDAIACLMYYKTALAPSEIAQLPKVCLAGTMVRSTTTTLAFCWFAIYFTRWLLTTKF